MKKPLVALVGRPNVGKSTLFNRLIGERRAVISDIAGTTRDRLQGDTDWNGVIFTVVDTGGIEIHNPKAGQSTEPLAEDSVQFIPQIRAQALVAIQDADVIVLVTDTQQGVTAADEEVAEILQKSNKPIVIAANKADHHKAFDEAMDFYTLGLGEVIPLSALHGDGTGDLLDRIVELFPPAPEYGSEEEEDHLKIAIIGRPNVGKSSLLNKLLGEERAIVSDIAGTTRDALDSDIQWHGQRITLIDTAGIRRRGKIEPGIEQYSVLRTLKAIQRADVALLLIDASEGITAQDTHIAGMVLDELKSLIIVVNKWDIVEKDSYTIYEFTDKIKEDFSFMAYAPILFISALTGQRVHQILETTMSVYEERVRRIPTSELNRIVREAVARHAPTSQDLRKLKIYYATQVRVDPPTFLFHVNEAELVHFSYERYLENSIREAFPFAGTPIRLSFRSRSGGLEE
ncbi:MAG: GTPase Der [Chloroflexota bacterium]|nr:ribosome biogenesis GTPase Der [Chloroflexota bacterium]NOG63434.1 ribosome biogenesis GTPase Der [Chloroflexota bacterium]GIK62293.1 MAG: GTPase Der [Chloroflexota bacterium]